MILSNYWKYRNSLDTQAQDNNTVMNGMVSVTGAASGIALGAEACLVNYKFDNSLSYKFGTGSNEYTSDAYALADDITSSIGNVSASFNSSGADTLSRVISISGSNTSASEITITEVGIVKTVGEYGNMSKTNDIMMAICQLRTPVTVPANGTFQIPLNWIEQ